MFEAGIEATAWARTSAVRLRLRLRLRVIVLFLWLERGSVIWYAAQATVPSWRYRGTVARETTILIQALPSQDAAVENSRNSSATFLASSATVP